MCAAMKKTHQDLLSRAVAKAIEPLERRVLFASGDLDALFNNGGMVTLDTFGDHDFGNAVAVQSDNKVLVGGYVSTPEGYDVAVARFNVDGTLDTSFGSGGVAVTDLGTSFDTAFALKVQGDGKVVLAGGTLGVGGDFALVRYNANGTLDSGFGSGGIVRTDIQQNHDMASAMTLTSDGHIVVVGSAIQTGWQQFAVAKYTSSGALDSTFGGGDGIAVIEFAGGQSVGRAVTMLADGSMIVAGQAMSFDDLGMSYAAVKLGADGTQDAMFGTDGWAKVNLGGLDERANAVVILGGGRIVLVGESTTDSGQDVGLAALTSDGQLDTTFGGGAGYVVTDFAGGYDWGAGAYLQADGKILVAGSAGVNGLSEFAAARYNPDGSLDSTFGGGGTVSHPFAAGESFGNAVTLDGQGRILIAGNVITMSGTFDLALMRLENTVVLPNAAPTANPGGTYTVMAGQSVVVTGGGSHDVDGSVVVYEWDFNYDGNSFDVDATGASPTFNAPSNAGGTVRTVALRVIDNNGAVSVVSTTTITINVVPPPPPPPPPPAPSGNQAPGTALLVSDPANPGKKMLSVLGTSGTDQVHFKAGKKGNVEVRLGNKKLGTFSGMTRIVVDGGAGNDVLDAHGLSVPVALFGGKGNDVMRGGTNNDILVGGEGDDVIFGGKGNDVIVGGAGRDELYSVLGNDVLVGGSLKFENDVTSMSALLAEWTRTDRSLSQRVANLMNGGGKNGSVKMSGNVVDDNVRDVMFGNPNADWLVTGNNDRVQRVG